MAYKINLRHNSRVLALSSLFCFMFADEEELYSTLLFKEEFGELNYDSEFYYLLLNGVKDKIEEIYKTITKSAPDWPLKNIAKIDLAVLRLGVFELLYTKETPRNVVIDEAIELAKKFGNDSSSKFINGVLDNLK